jgi:1-pyrroline-5-carboxylate dehydrogenase
MRYRHWLNAQEFLPSSRYVMYGEVSAKVAEEMRRPETADFFAKIIQRTSPKSYPQAMAELIVTRRFFENFSGDQVSVKTHRNS